MINVNVGDIVDFDKNNAAMWQYFFPHHSMRGCVIRINSKQRVAWVVQIDGSAKLPMTIESLRKMHYD